MVHALLERQLKTLGLQPDQLPQDPAAWAKLLERISRVYAQNTQDRYLLERSLMLASEEMQAEITERKNMEVALKQALAKEKELGDLKSRFVTMASHEFRTPLAAILSTTETLTIYRDRLTSDEVNTRLDKIRQQVNHMRAVMEDVLQLARLEAGKNLAFMPEVMDFHRQCSDIVEEFETQERHQGRLRYHGATNGCLCHGDPRLIRKFVSNLISNALKYSPEDKPVTVWLKADEVEIVFTVQDEGIGIPDKDLYLLFEPFYRASNVGVIAGTGLGLTISRQAIEMHGGSISIATQENVGTTFVVRIPRYSPLRPKANP